MLALACAVFLSAGVTLAGLGPALPQLALNIGREIASLGWMFTAMSAGIILAQFGAGPASDRFGQPPVLAAGMLLMSIGAVGVTLGTSLVLLLAGALLTGIGFGCVLSAGNVLVALLFPTRSAAALNGANVFFGLGSVIGPALAGFAGARLGRPESALWAGALILLALVPAVLSGARPARAGAREPGSAAGGRASSSLWLISALLLVYIGTEVGFGAWVTVYMITSARLLPVAAALVASCYWLALTLGRVLGSVAGMRLAPAHLLMLSLLGVLAGTAVLNLGVGSLAGSVAGALLFGLSCGPVFPTVLAIVTGAARASGTAASLVLAVGNCGGLIIPALLGLLLSQYGAPAAAGLLLGTALIMVALCAVLLRSGAAGAFAANLKSQ
jgi:fucose permease